MMQLGLEHALENAPAPLAQGARFALLMNQASVDASFQHAHRLLARRFPGQLAALFGPQHGLWSEQQDNMIETGHGFDPELEVPVYSLYAEQRAPRPEMLEGLDLFIIDLQDVGCRVYTYVWTLLLCMRACAKAGVPVLVLDRPNPVGSLVEGPVLEPGFESFVGLWSIPMRHGLSLGELARLLAAEDQLDLDLQVVACQGWHREQRWQELGRPWVPSSPNLPRNEGVEIYPGMVLFEGTQLSEGRGTTTPFEILGAPGLDPRAWLQELAPFAEACAGAALRPIRFEPTFQKHAKQSCSGLFVHSLDRERIRPYALALALIGSAKLALGEDFAWLPPPYEYEEEIMPFDILTGSSAAREAIDIGLNPETLAGLTQVAVAGWRERCTAQLLYPGDLRSSHQS
ncbi:MAG: hypothetical protein CSA62_04945 [Planctomycetota bacterium]|nr:MAG: hypothetical protein CSA62_04945 [Planctomycetota bacterium]